MAIELFQSFYIYFGVTNAFIAHKVGVTESAIEKHQTQPEMKWRPTTAIRFVDLLTEYLERLDEVAPYRQQTVIDTLREVIPRFPNVDVQPMMQAEVERTVQRLGLK